MPGPQAETSRLVKSSSKDRRIALMSSRSASVPGSSLALALSMPSVRAVANPNTRNRRFAEIRDAPEARDVSEENGNAVTSRAADYHCISLSRNSANRGPTVHKRYP
ncbi:protein of unknown function [Nitratireductor aquimarinus]